MAGDRVAILRKYFDAWDSARFEPSVEDVDPSVEIDWSESKAPYGGTYYGHAGWRQLFSEIRQVFDDAWVEAHDYVESGPYVAVRNTARMRGREGIEVIARSTIVFTFREDVIVAARLYQEDADALAAIRESGD